MFCFYIVPFVSIYLVVFLCELKYSILCAFIMLPGLRHILKIGSKIQNSHNGIVPSYHMHSLKKAIGFVTLSEVSGTTKIHRSS